MWGSLTIKFHRSEKKISSVLLKKCLLGMYKNNKSGFVRDLLFIFSQTTGTVSLDVVLGAGILKSKPSCNMFCVTPKWN